LTFDSSRPISFFANILHLNCKQVTRSPALSVLAMRRLTKVVLHIRDPLNVRLLSNHSSEWPTQAGYQLASFSGQQF